MEKLTQADKKLILQFQKWFETEGIESKILELREEMGIPLEGFLLTDKDREELGNIFLTPHALSSANNSKLTICLRGCFVGSRELLGDGRQLLNNTFFKQVLRVYIFFNQFLFEDIHASLPIHLRQTSLCDISDAYEDLYVQVGFEGEHAFDPELAKTYIDSQRSITELFPIALRIHPEASQRDILDFIKKHWTFIKILQEQQKDKNPKILYARTKTNQAIKQRNDLIYKLHNAGKTTKEIRKELAKNQYFLDDGHILKIISLRKRKPENK